VPITVAHGDGIGPEIMDATLRVLEAAGASLAIETIQIGEAVYERGVTAGIEPASWESLHRTKVFLKALITTPQGGGFKSLNVTVRKTLGRLANVRPCPAYAPFVATKHPDMDVVVVRENEEDLYAGIEHRQTDEVVQTLELFSRPGCERISRYAFEYGRHKVTCFTKDNIMKISDGLFHEVFDEVAAEYPDIELDSAMFEAIHGSAPRRAGQDLANPSGLMLGAIQMLVDIGQGDIATKVHNAWLRTIEDGVQTYDSFNPEVSSEKVGTTAFADSVIQRLGSRPEQLRAVDYPSRSASSSPLGP
jgi:isocitrate dehydrogenase